MPQYDDNMSGVLFKNDRKESDRHPDYKGSGEVNKVEVWISAWIKTKKDGSGKFLSLAFDNKQGQRVSTQDVPIDNAGLSASAPAEDDDIPF